MFFPLACVAGEMENPGRERIRPETAASMKTLCREVTAAEKQSFQNPSFDGTRYSIPDAPPYWDVDFASGELARIYVRTYLLHSHQLVSEDIRYSSSRKCKDE